MNKVKKIIEEWLPGYSRLPLLLVVCMNTLTYFGTRPFTQQMVHHSMALPVDDWIPLNTWFIYVYLLAYVQWILGFLLIARESKAICTRFLYGEIIAKAICMCWFLLYPTTIIRPEIQGNRLADVLTRYIYEMDAADNLFPSIHCLESYVCFRSSLLLKKVPKWYPYVTFVFSALVFGSTVFLKQHVAADMVGAVLAVEIGLFVTKLLSRKHTTGAGTIY